MFVTEPDSRPLSTGAAISLAVLTAAAVIGAGVFLIERREPARPAAPSAAMPLPTVIAAPPTLTPAIATAAPSATTSASATPPLEASSLPPRLGVLTVRGQGDARVYVNGEDLGPLNEALKAPCGLRYVRLGTAREGTRPPTWLSPGQSVTIACRAATEIEAPSGK